jgi:hypothetical protein
MMQCVMGDSGLRAARWPPVVVTLIDQARPNRVEQPIWRAQRQ